MLTLNDSFGSKSVLHSTAYHKNNLKKHPNDPESLHYLGLRAISKGNLNKGVKMVKRAIFYAPLNAFYHETLAKALYAKKDLSNAKIECRLALRMDNRLYEPLNILGLINRDQQNYEKAISFFTKAMKKQVPYPDAMNNLSTTLIRKGEYKTAEKYLRLVIDLEPNNFRAWNNLGLTLRGTRNLQESNQAFLKAKQFLPSQFNLGHNYLLMDEISKGLTFYEYRKNILGIGKTLKKPEWNGKPHKQKTLLVIHEQGLGDTIMMSRFFPVLTSYFKKVIIKVQKPLLRLIETIDPRLFIVTDTTDVSYDFWCPVMSLPYRLNIDHKDKIPTSPWLNIPGVKKNNKKLQIGINWAGNPAYTYDSIRSTHLKNIDMLLKTNEVDWISLHKGHLEKEAAEYNLPQPLLSAHDFYDTAQLIDTLDLVVSTETAVPNLSAAMGVPTCVLTTPDYDWRWQNWYQNVFICNQDIQGNWYGSIAKALEVLSRLVISNES